MRGFSWVCVVLAVTGLGSLVSPGRVEAGVLRLNMSGLTGLNTTTSNGPVAYGTPWSLAADFDTASVGNLNSFVVGAPAINVRVVVAGTTYTPTTNHFKVILSTYGSYSPGISGLSGLSAIYSNVTPSNWDPSAPTPVVFGGFSSMLDNLLTIQSSAGTLILETGNEPSASITSASSPAVPEPSLVSLAIGGAAFGLVALRRRARRG